MRQFWQAYNQTRGTILCERLEVASGLAEQSRGLLGRDRLEPGAGLMFENGPIIPFMWMHMFFMRFPIDIVFLDKPPRETESAKVIKINRDLKPWRVSSVVFGARTALEIESGASARSDTEEGDIIILRKL